MRKWFLIGGLLTVSAGHASVHVRNITLSPSANGYRLSVDADGKARYTLRTYPEPARLIVDIPDAVLEPESELGPAGPGPAPTLRFSQFKRKPDAVRVVVHLPAGILPWREVSSSPARAIVVDIPYATNHQSSSLAAPAKTDHEHRTTTTRTTAHSAQKLADAGRNHTVFGPPSPVTVEREPARIERTQLASRKGEVDTSDLMVDPAAAPAPAWDPDEAISLVRSGDCPEALRKRLIDVVSDPAIQTSRYVWGAETPGQFDCSGLVLYIYDALGVKLPRCSWQQCDVGESVEKDALRAGDLVFFNTKGNGVSHVGIYLGDGRFLHAANPKSNLKITSLDTPYYATRFVNARRVYGVSDSSSLGG